MKDTTQQSSDKVATSRPRLHKLKIKNFRAIEVSFDAKPKMR